MVLGAERVEENGVGNVRSFSETTRLFNWGFDNFSYRTVLKADEIVKEAAVSLSKVDHVTVHPAQEVEILLPNNLTAEDLERTVVLEDPVEAPVTEGQVLGTLELSYDGQIYASVDLLALNDVEASRLLVFWRNVELFFAKPVVRVIFIVLAVLIIALILWKLTLGRRRYRYGRSVGRSGGSSYRGRRRR